jgi:hypothetical protein
MAGGLDPRQPGEQQPKFPSRGSQPRRRETLEQANAATFAALVGLGGVAISLIAMAALVLPQIRGLILVLLAAVGFFAVHYVVWGWWLPKMVPHNDSATEDKTPAAEGRDPWHPPDVDRFAD